MRGSRKLCQRGSDTGNVFINFLFVFVFSLEERSETPLQGAHHRSVSETPFKWRAAGVPMMALHGMLAWLLCDFSGFPDQYC